MREILFRGKRKYNGEWIEGYYAYAYGKHYIMTVCATCALPPYHWYFKNHEVGPSTICQCTGLKDKNGKLIWENDIVRCVDYNSGSEFMAVVEFGNPNSFYSCGHQFRHIKGDKPNLDILLWIDMEETGATCAVIGNIFDNTDLLKGE